MILQARRQGKFCTMTNLIIKWFTPKLLSLVMKYGSSQLDKIYNYKMDWDEKIKT